MYNDITHKGNSKKYHTGKECIKLGCNKLAGTAWSPFWCFECNVKRIDKINKQFETILVERIKNHDNNL